MKQWSFPIFYNNFKKTVFGPDPWIVMTSQAHQKRCWPTVICPLHYNNRLSHFENWNILISCFMLTEMKLPWCGRFCQWSWSDLFSSKEILMARWSSLWGCGHDHLSIRFSFSTDYDHFTSRELIEIYPEILFDWDLVSFLIVSISKTSPTAND